MLLAEESEHEPMLVVGKGGSCTVGIGVGGRHGVACGEVERRDVVNGTRNCARWKGAAVRAFGQQEHLNVFHLAKAWPLACYVEHWDHGRRKPLIGAYEGRGQSTLELRYRW